MLGFNSQTIGRFPGNDNP